MYAPQLPTLVKATPGGPKWVHEIKYDGYRIGARIEGGNVALITRNGNDWTAAFPEIRAAVKELPLDQALIDGEACVVLPNGITSFQALQGVLKQHRRHNLVYIVFDLLHLDGRELSSLPLDERKAILAELVGKVPSDAIVRYSHHFEDDGSEVLREACRMGLEGIVSKRRDLPYESGRSRNWLKTKCIKRQEFVIGGFTDPEGSRSGIGALLVGVNDGGHLRFAGKVGTGFTADVLTDLRRRLNLLHQKECPFSPRPAGGLGRNAHWVKPELVAEVAFTEWTDDGKIRHPSFQGLREDKPASAVIREVAVASAENPHQPVRAAEVIHPKKSSTAEVAGVRITHPDRPLYTGINFSKLDLAHYYESISDYILPHLRGRPLTLVRCPEGLSEECFYMKHSKLWAPEPLRRVNIPEKTKIGEYLVVDSLPALIGLVQMDILEIHTWNSTTDHLEQPDRIVFDLDPGPAVEWPQVIEAAHLVNSMLTELGLEGFVKTTGGVGLHVVVPLVPQQDWKDCFGFARGFAEAIVRRDPKLYTIALPKPGRKHKILIDYLRNNRTNTSVTAYSTRARPKAPVSVPLVWNEMTPALRSDHYTVTNLDERLKQLKNDPWKGYWISRQRLSRQMMKQVGSL